MSRSSSSKRRTNPKERKGTREAGTRTCGTSGGKVRYPRRKAALTGLNNMRRLRLRENPDGSRPESVYRCPHCGDWHLTSRPPDDQY